MLTNKYQAKHEDDQWLSISDLMAGLMMVFLFISIALMRNAMNERDMVKDVAVAYQENQVAIYNALNSEFKDDLKKWDAVINQDDLTFTFNSPDTLFPEGKSALQLKYRKILNDFFPRYLRTVLKFENSISEIRIEGHTSSVWNHRTNMDDAYFKNMTLSQGRTRSVLHYVYNLKKMDDKKQWIKSHMAAVGYSSSKPILVDGVEDQAASRRVTFRVVTNSDIQIRKILGAK